MANNPDTAEAKIRAIVIRIRAGKDPETGSLHISEKQAVAQLKGLLVDAKIEELQWVLDSCDNLGGDIRYSDVDDRLAALRQTRQEEDKNNGQ